LVFAVPPIFVEVVGLFDGVPEGFLVVVAEPPIVFLGLGDGFGLALASTSNSQPSS
jgi:hypothetical protein